MYWIALVAAVVVALVSRVPTTNVALGTVSLAIIGGAVVFFSLDAIAERRVEAERTRRFLAQLEAEERARA